MLFNLYIIVDGLEQFVGTYTDLMAVKCDAFELVLDGVTNEVRIEEIAVEQKAAA